METTVTPTQASMLHRDDAAVAAYFADQPVFVTGGAGMVGSSVVEHLVQMGARVTVPVRATTSLENLALVKDRIRLVSADLFERRSLDGVIGGHPIVLHLAAAKGGGIAHSMQHHGSLFRDNLLSSIHVLDAARDAGVRRLVVVSSACVYPRDCQSPIPEEDGVVGAPEATNAGYGWSKRMIEYMSLAYREQYGMNIGIARPFNTYGPRDDFFRPYSHVIPGLIRRFVDGDLSVWGSGNQTRSFVYVTDVVRGVLRLAAHEDAVGPFNIGTDEEVTIRELAETLRDLVGRSSQPLHLDASKPDGQPRRSCDTRRAREKLGFVAQTSLREGLRASIDWYLAEKAHREAT